MIQIEDVVVSFDDPSGKKFLCNLDACKGECCIEGELQGHLWNWMSGKLKSRR